MEFPSLISPLYPTFHAVPEAIDSDRFTQAIHGAMSCEAHSLCMACQRLESPRPSPHSFIIIEGTMIVSLRYVILITFLCSTLIDVVQYMCMQYLVYNVPRAAGVE